jgi:hypothetical protein
LLLGASRPFFFVLVDVVLGPVRFVVVIVFVIVVFVGRVVVGRGPEVL